MEETRWKEKNQYLGLTEDGRRVRLLDQSQLPNREVWLELEEPEELAEAIRTLRVRGAPAIGVFAAYALYVLARRLADRAPVEAAFRTRLREWAAGLAATRPTAVNLRWALERMLARADRTAGPPEQIVQVLERECRAIHREDGEMCRRIAEHGLTLVGEGDGILTHCNAGALAASRYGTALGPILLGQERGKKLRVFADETRPLLQGARLTAWELQQAGVDVTLICDNMASSVMRRGWVQAVFVGCDRVAANGDTAHKIGNPGGPGPLLQCPLLCTGPYLHYRLGLSHRSGHPHRGAGRGRDPLPLVPGAHGASGGEVLGPRLRRHRPQPDLCHRHGGRHLPSPLRGEPAGTGFPGKGGCAVSWSREKQELRRKICQAARQIAQAGYVAANDGNLSARCSDGGVLITPSGVYKGDLEEDMLLEVDLEGRVLSGTGRPSSESPMHLALYRTRPEVGGVVHTHAPYSVFSANLGEDLTEPITADWALLLGPVPALPWLPLGTEELAGAVARAAEGHSAALLAHHGAVTWGRDVVQAWHRTQALEQYCKQRYLGLLLGRPIPVLEPEEVRELTVRRLAGEERRN